MTFPTDPNERSPKGDHNRRLSLGIEAAEFAATAGVTPDELRAYEFTNPDGSYDLGTAERVGQALERLEAAIDQLEETIEPIVDNGAPPLSDTLEGRLREAFASHELISRLARTDMEQAEELIASELAAIDPTLQLVGVGERPRGPVHEIVVTWREAASTANHEAVIALPAKFQA